MTVTELQGNEQLRRALFPVAEKQIYLAHAGVCPLPQPVVDAIGEYSCRAAQGDQETVCPLDFISSTRSFAAQLLGAKPSEIALVGPTSLALSYVANGLTFRKGDNVLIYFDDYPSNVYPWMSLAQRGVEVRLLNVRGLGQIRPKDVMGQVDENTRLVALASAHFISGHRLDLEAVGKFLRHRGILFCVDGIQTLGAFPTTIEHVDILAADSHKWLLGPCGAGVMYVRTEVQEKLRPTTFGWHNIRSPDYVAQEELRFRPDARRYEAGTQSLIGVAGLRAALRLILDFGVENIAGDLAFKRQRLVSSLREKGYTVLGEDEPGANSGITSFFLPEGDMTGLHKRLEEAGIVTSLRMDRSGQEYIRFSPHFYNTLAEIDQALHAL